VPLARKGALMTKAKVWHVMTVTRKGVVSLIKNVDEDAARQLMQRLQPRWNQPAPWSEASMRQMARYEARKDDPQQSHGGGGGHMYFPQDGDIERAEAFGPPNKTLAVWPKPATWDDDFAKAIEAAKAEYAEEKAKAQADALRADEKRAAQFAKIDASLAAMTEPDEPPKRKAWWSGLS